MKVEKVQTPIEKLKYSELPHPQTVAWAVP
jgi:hypothetical protein